jgi:hemerythrin
MAFATWTANLAIGVPFVDSDHQGLFTLVNQLHEDMMGGKGKDATRELLKALHQYASGHFEREERLLSQRGYPRLAEHQGLHATFIAKLDQIQDKFDHGSALVNIDLLRFLKTWLTEHIAAEDQTYATYLKEHGGLGA